MAALGVLFDTHFLIDLHDELSRKDGSDGPAKQFIRGNRTQPMVIKPVRASK